MGANQHTKAKKEKEAKAIAEAKAAQAQAELNQKAKEAELASIEKAKLAAEKASADHKEALAVAEAENAAKELAAESTQVEEVEETAVAMTRDEILEAHSSEYNPKAIYWKRPVHLRTLDKVVSGETTAETLATFIGECKVKVDLSNWVDVVDFEAVRLKKARRKMREKLGLKD